MGTPTPAPCLAAADSLQGPHLRWGLLLLLRPQPGLAQAILSAEKAGPPLLHPGGPVLMPLVLHMPPQRPLPFLCALNTSVLHLYPAGDTLFLLIYGCVWLVLLKQLRELTRVRQASLEALAKLCIPGNQTHWDFRESI